MNALFEKYRPKTWTDVVGQDKAIKQLRFIENRSGFAGKAFWIRGQTGTGKTTIAKIIAAEIAEPWNVYELDATSVNAEMLNDAERMMQLWPLGEKTARVWIVNEAHKLTGKAVARFKDLLEAPKMTSHSCWIFTTDAEETLFEGSEDPGPLLARCTEVSLSRRDLATAFAANSKRIAELEGLDGQDIEQYVKLAKECGNSHRKMLQRIQDGCMVLG